MATVESLPCPIAKSSETTSLETEAAREPEFAPPLATITLRATLRFKTTGWASFPVPPTPILSLETSPPVILRPTIRPLQEPISAPSAQPPPPPVPGQTSSNPSKRHGPPCLPGQFLVPVVDVAP